MIRGDRIHHDVEFICRCPSVDSRYHDGRNGMALRGSQGNGGQKECVGKGASLDYNEGMTKLACLQRMVR
jgi:hypothetical protein